MRIANADEARSWLKSWGGSPPSGLLKAAIAGTVLSASLSSGPSKDRILEALKVLERKRTKARPHSG
tara:strand:+ start:14591 stop:14791 length:201 start_codon:yes stop_codon:yes gene_type:complete